MDQGSMRCAANISLKLKGAKEFGTRTETKNVNSLKSVEVAVRYVMATIEYEARRQVEVQEDGGTIVQETRLFDPGTGTTRSMRSKEDAHDYRYFPDPDLLPLELNDAFLDECRQSLPELPDAKRRRYCDDLGLSAYNAGVLTAEVETARWFEALLSETAAAQGKNEAEVAKQASNWLISEFFGALNKAGHSLEDSPVSQAAAAELLALIGKGTISGSIAKQVLEKMLETGDGATAIVEREGLKQESDSGAIEAAVDQVLAANADKVAEYRAGKQALFGFFVGQTMKAMQGKANPQVVNELLRGKLG
jgi:aspartyl-tRNA(Asn)/glutamyl-tRNA(Gln) amidotransferase subunit B